MVDSEEEDKPSKAEEKCGSRQLQLHPDSEIYKKIAQSNHKYWQNRYLFSPETVDFVKQMLLYWNTSYVIPAQTSCRNEDLHLTLPLWRQQNELANQPMSFRTMDDEQINLLQVYTKEQLQGHQLMVFKFAASFYFGVMQRAFNKSDLPEFVRYLKAYLNYDVECAKWFLVQFANTEIIKECYLESPAHSNIMRKILTGLCYCAMLKVYPLERATLNVYWDHLKANKTPQTTILGNMICCVLSCLPQLRDKYNSN